MLHFTLFYNVISLNSLLKLKRGIEENQTTVLPHPSKKFGKFCERSIEILGKITELGQLCDDFSGWEIYVYGLPELPSFFSVKTSYTGRKQHCCVLSCQLLKDSRRDVAGGRWPRKKQRTAWSKNIYKLIPLIQIGKYFGIIPSCRR